uniref:Uncharacterized protein n=1 Tax=Arundo donax TaxID=35708 RepID=A0A0A9DCK1_ARUDO
METKSPLAGSSAKRPNQTKSAPPSLPPNPPISAMEGKDPGADMEALIRRLSLHRAAPSPYDPSPAAAPAPAAAGELFRPRRAAVLVCLFRGATGELRVILAKRSSFSTHSGELLARVLIDASVWFYLAGAIDPNLGPMLETCRDSGDI